MRVDKASISEAQQENERLKAEISALKEQLNESRQKVGAFEQEIDKLTKSEKTL